MESNQKPLAAKRSRKVIKKEALQDSSIVTVMDEQVWKELSEDLLKGVIARLPITAFFRFRSVCREWNSLHKCQSFLQRCEEVGSPQSKPWLYSIIYGDLGRGDTSAMYDPCAKKWLYCSAESTPALYPVASFGGLVCCVDPGKQCFIVGNPITKTWKELSCSSNVGSHLGTICLGMVTNNSASSRGYKIVVVGSWGGYEVYECSMNNNSTITTTGLIPENITLMTSPLPFHRRYTHPFHRRYTCPVTIDTVVYFLISNPSGILSFDAVSGGWKVFHIPPPPNSTDLSLAECGERILLMGLVRDNDEYEGSTMCVCVWELQRTMLVWTEVDRMPCSDSDCKEAYLMCVGNKGVLMMVLQNTQMNRILTYDVVNREWSKVPRYVVTGRGWLLYTDGGIAFFPSLSAAP